MPLRRETNASVQIEKSPTEAPQDRYWLVYYLYLLLGLVHILPLSFFVTANDYYMYKFRNTSSSTYDLNHKTTLQVEFTPGLAIFMQLPKVMFYFLGLFTLHKFALKTKLVGSLLVMLLSFLATIIFIFINTDNWQGLFFAITMAIVSIINGIDAIFDLTIMSILALFPKIYLGAYLCGMGIATVFTSLLQISALAIGISTDRSALVYFCVGTSIVGLSVVFLMATLGRNAFFKFCLEHKQVKETSERLSFERIFYIFKKVWPGTGMMLFWIILRTSTFPAIATLVVSEGAGTSTWNDKYFTPVMTFLLFSIMDYSGRVLGQKIKIKIQAIYLVGFSALRMLVFAPLFMFVNAQPRHLPVVFDKDYQYILIMIFFALTNGYVGYMINAVVPQLIPLDELEDGLQVNAVASSICMGVCSFLPFTVVNLI